MIRWVLIFLMPVFFGACQNAVELPFNANELEDPTDSEEQQAEEIENPSIFAFQQTLEPLLNERCGNCHGVFQAPLFSQANQSEGNHNLLLEGNLVNLTLGEDPSLSRLVFKVAQNNHNCWSSNCESDGFSIYQKIQDWILLEEELSSDTPQDSDNDDSSSGWVQTAIRYLPPPSTFDPDELKLLTFSLNGFEGSTGQMFFQITIGLFGNTAYEIKEPRVFTNRNLYIKRPIIHVNHLPFNENGNFSQIDTIVSGGSSGQSVSEASVILPFEQIVENPTGEPDFISFSFEVLELAE